jgi:hypothetical protein
VIKSVVAVVGEGGSTVVFRGVQHGSDLNQRNLGAAGINSSATLEIGCSPPGHRGKFKKFLQTTTHPLTSEALLLSKVLSWISAMALIA